MPAKKNSVWRSDAKSLLALTWRQFREDNCPLIAAGLAYYSLFSLVPLLLLAWLGVGRFLGYEAAMGKISPELSQLVGSEIAQAVESMVQVASIQDAETLTLMSLAAL